LSAVSKTHTNTHTTHTFIEKTTRASLRLYITRLLIKSDDDDCVHVFFFFFFFFFFVDIVVVDASSASSAKYYYPKTKASSDEMRRREKDHDASSSGRRHLRSSKLERGGVFAVFDRDRTSRFRWKEEEKFEQKTSDAKTSGQKRPIFMRGITGDGRIRVLDGGYGVVSFRI